MDLTERIKNTPVGGYTSYLRYMAEPCLINAQKADIRNMELLGFSKLNPTYLIERIKQYFKSKKVD